MNKKKTKKSKPSKNPTKMKSPKNKQRKNQNQYWNTSSSFPRNKKPFAMTIDIYIFVCRTSTRL